MGKCADDKARELTEQLKRSDAGVLAAIEVYCVAYERWRAANDWIDAHGDTAEIVNDKGVVIRAQKAPKLDAIAQYEKSMAEAMKTIKMHLQR